MKRAIITLGLATLFGGAAFAGVAPAAPAPAAITQHPGGVLIGRHDYGFGYEWDNGDYVNLSQLGRGSYHLDDTGTAIFRRSSDQTQLTGRVTGTVPCDVANDVLCYKVDLTGTRDILSATLVLKGGWT